jgi:hypothetical protein
MTVLGFEIKLMPKYVYIIKEGKRVAFFDPEYIIVSGCNPALMDKRDDFVNAKKVISAVGKLNVDSISFFQLGL